MKNIMGYLTFAVLVGMAIILSLNFSRLFTQQKNERYLSYNGVRGIAVDHNRKLWTLNFDQQNKVIEHLNLCLPIGKGSQHMTKQPFAFDRIVVYRFKAPDLYLTPIALDGPNLILEAKELNPSGYLLDVSGGSFNTLLQTTYDP